MADYQVEFTSVSIPSGTEADCILHEDESGGTTSDNNTTFTLSDGQTTYTVGGFQAQPGNSVWLVPRLRNPTDLGASVEIGFPATITPPVSWPTPGVSATAGGAAGEIDVTWNDADYETGYEVEYQKTGTVGWTTFSTPAADVTSETVTGLQEGTDYDIRVTATDGSNTISDTDTATSNAPAPTLNSVSVNTGDGDKLDVAWTDNGTDETAYRVLLSFDGGAFSQDGSDLPADSTSHTTSALLDGEQYTVKVRAVYEDTTTDSGTQTATTELPDAAQPTLDNSTEDQLGYSLPDDTDNGDYRIQIRETGEASWSGSAAGFAEDVQASDADVSGSVTGTFAGLQDGEEYEVRARTETEHVNGAWTTPVSAIALLPDATIASIDASVEDQLTVNWTDVIDNGDYRVQIRETGESTWGVGTTGFQEATEANGSTSHTFAGLEDGEGYDVRLRTETPHVNGAYDTASGVTLLPVPTGFSIDARDDTVDCSWIDHADNEDEYRLQRSTDGGSTWSTVTTVAANSMSASDSSPPFYQSVDYRVVAATEHSTAASGSASTIPVRSGHWYIEISRGGTTDIIPPDHIRDGQLDREHSTVSGLTAELVPADTDYEGKVQGDVTAFYGAQQHFPGTVIKARQKSGVQQLICEDDLIDLEEDAPSAPVTYSNITLEDAIDDYWQNQQSIASATTHPAFVNTVRTNELWYDVPQVDDFDLITSIPSTEPFVVTAASIKTAQTLWFLEAENGQVSGGTDVQSAGTTVDDLYSNDHAIKLDAGADQVAVDFTPEHDIPKGDFQLNARTHFDNLDADVVATIDGQEIYRQTWNNQTDSQIGWSLYSTDADPSTDLSAGTTYTVVIKLENYTGGDFFIDAFAPHDTGDRYSANSRINYGYNFDNTVTTPGYTLAGPELHPQYAAFDIVANENWHVPELDLVTTFDQTDNSQQLSASTDGTTFLTANNTETATFDFAANDIVGSTATMRVRLGRTDSGTAPSPTNGDTEQEISAFEARLDTDDLPIIEQTVTLDGDTHLANIQKLHNQGPFRFVVDHTQATLTVDSFRKGDSSLVKSATWTAVDGTVERAFTTQGYFNRIKAYGDGVSRDLVHSGEQTAFGEEVVESRRYDETDGDALAVAAREDLIKAVAKKEFTGGFDIAPKIIDPGWPYTVPEFGNSEASLERVTFALADGTGTLSFGRRGGLVARLQELKT